MGAERDAIEAATRFREDHGLGHQPLADLVALIERTTGVDVAVVDAPADAHGMTAHDPESGVTFIAVAKSMHPMRQRSTLAHELGHMLFSDRAAEKDGRWSARDPFEIRADAFARHLLIPVLALKAFLGAGADVGEQQLSDVVQWFGVSPAIAAIALREAGLIGDKTKAEWMHVASSNLAARYGWIDQYNSMKANSSTRRSPQKLLARAVRGYREGVVGVRAIARLLAIDEPRARSVLESGDTRHGGEVRWAASSSIPDVDADLSDLGDVPELAE